MAAIRGTKMTDVTGEQKPVVVVTLSKRTLLLYLAQHAAIQHTACMETEAKMHAEGIIDEDVAKNPREKLIIEHGFYFGIHHAFCQIAKEIEGWLETPEDLDDLLEKRQAQMESRGSTKQ